jgi:hypothetical protein
MAADAGARCGAPLPDPHLLPRTDAGALVKTKTPRISAQLRFHQRVKSTRDYGLKEH